MGLRHGGTEASQWSLCVSQPWNLITSELQCSLGSPKRQFRLASSTQDSRMPGAEGSIDGRLKGLAFLYKMLLRVRRVIFRAESVARLCDPSNQEAEAQIHIPGLPRLHSETLLYPISNKRRLHTRWSEFSALKFLYAFHTTGLNEISYQDSEQSLCFLSSLTSLLPRGRLLQQRHPLSQGKVLQSNSLAFEIGNQVGRACTDQHMKWKWTSWPLSQALLSSCGFSSLGVILQGYPTHPQYKPPCTPILLNSHTLAFAAGSIP